MVPKESKTARKNARSASKALSGSEQKGDQRHRNISFINSESWRACDGKKSGTPNGEGQRLKLLGRSMLLQKILKN